jgi:hypothetical protein
MTTMVCACDVVTWQQWDERLRAFHFYSAKRGEEFDLPEDVCRQFELDAEKVDVNGRLLDPRPRVLSPEDYATWTNKVLVKQDPVLSVTDDELKSMDPELLLARMQTLPGLAKRVYELEQKRQPQRKPVLAVAKRMMEAEEGADVALSDPEPAALLPSDA